MDDSSQKMVYFSFLVFFFTQSFANDSRKFFLICSQSHFFTILRSSFFKSYLLFYKKLLVREIRQKMFKKVWKYQKLLFLNFYLRKKWENWIFLRKKNFAGKTLRKNFFRWEFQNHYYQFSESRGSSGSYESNHVVWRFFG